jgi:hypothetical protein
MTRERALEIIARLSDDDLISIATTCSNRGVALAAETHLRKRHPSKVKLPSREADNEKS